MRLSTNRKYKEYEIEVTELKNTNSELKYSVEEFNSRLDEGKTRNIFKQGAKEKKEF